VPNLQVALGGAQEAALEAEAAQALLPHAVLLPRLLVQVGVGVVARGWGCSYPWYWGKQGVCLLFEGPFLAPPPSIVLGMSPFERAVPGSHDNTWLPTDRQPCISKAPTRGEGGEGGSWLAYLAHPWTMPTLMRQKQLLPRQQQSRCHMLMLCCVHLCLALVDHPRPLLPG